jgi:NADH dehydrogenase
MILVVGGTGRLGSLVANLLAAQGREVRVLSRGLTPAVVPLDQRVERVLGDVRDPTRMQEMVAGAEVVLLAMQGFLGPGRVNPRSVDHQGSRNVIAAAEQVDADVVLLSIAGASATSPLELARVKYGVEEHLRRARCRWTVVRSDAFAQTWFDVLRQTAAKSHRPIVFGNGDNPFGFVDVHEVAALVEHAVLQPSLRGHTLEISGPERLTLEQLATLMMEQHGWPGKPRRVPRLALRMMATLAAPVRPELARQARASLAMDVLPPVDDHETRAAFPDLPALPVSRLLKQTA